VRAEQLNVRLNADERRTLDRLAEDEHRTPADTIRILIVRAGAALGKKADGGAG